MWPLPFPLAVFGHWYNVGKMRPSNIESLEVLIIFTTAHIITTSNSNGVAIHPSHETKKHSIKLLGKDVSNGIFSVKTGAVRTP